MPNIITTLALSALLLGACKGSDGESGGGAFPTRVGESGDATSLAHAGAVSLTDDSAATEPRMDLSRPNRPGEAAAACYPKPTDTLGLGRAVCASDPKKSVEITAANVRFMCVGSPDFESTAVKTKITLPGCASAEIYSYKFEPSLVLSIGDPSLDDEDVKNIPAPE